MSYFMTISGAILKMPMVIGVGLLSAEDAQDYIKSLASDLASLDGKPVHLVHDCETGTSDIIISDLENALLDDEEIGDLPATKILLACFQNGLGFRIWRASNDPRAHIDNISAVANLSETHTAIRARRGATWDGAA